MGLANIKRTLFNDERELSALSWGGGFVYEGGFEVFLSSFSADFFYIVESDFFDVISLVSWLIILVGVAFHCSEWSDSFLSYSCFFLSCIEKA